MKPEVCQCPGCICELDGDAVRRGDRYYCCQACAEGHGQDQSCRDPECPCIDKARERRSRQGPPGKVPASGVPVSRVPADSPQAASEPAPEQTFRAGEPLSPGRTLQEKPHD